MYIHKDFVSTKMNETCSFRTMYKGNKVTRFQFKSRCSPNIIVFKYSTLAIL